MTNVLLNKVRALILAIGSLFLLIFIQIAGLFTFVTICKLVAGVDYSEEPILMAVFHILYAITVIVVFGLLRKSYRPVQSAKKSRVFRLIMLGIGIQAFVYGALNIVYEFAADTAIMESYKSTINNLNGNTTYIIFIYTMFFAPVAEEIVFRGVIFDALSTAFSFAAANVIQAALFGLYHGNVVQFVYAFIIGMLFGYVRHKNGKLADVIGVHMTVNISGILIVPFIAYGVIAFVGSVLTAYGIVSVFGLIIIIENIKKMCYNKINNA